MPPKRCSKRLLGEQPSGEKTTKRLRKPNTNTLDAFSAQQAPVHRRKTGKRRVIKAPELPKPVPRGKKVPATPILISSTPGGAPSSPTPSTPVPARRRANAPPPSSPFDLSEEGKKPLYVALMITPVIDDSRKYSKFTRRADIVLRPDTLHTSRSRTPSNSLRQCQTSAVPTTQRSSHLRPIRSHWR